MATSALSRLTCYLKIKRDMIALKNIREIVGLDLKAPVENRQHEYLSKAWLFRIKTYCVYNINCVCALSVLQISKVKSRCIYLSGDGFSCSENGWDCSWILVLVSTHLLRPEFSFFLIPLHSMGRMYRNRNERKKKLLKETVKKALCNH